MNKIHCELKALICLLGIRHSAKKVFNYYNLLIRKTGKKIAVAMILSDL